MQITKQGDRLLVPDHPVIPFIEGDGIGKEITPFVQQIIDAAVEKKYGGKRQITWQEVLAGEKAYNKVGSWLPAETVETFRNNPIGIKGPLTTPVGEGIRSLNVALRQELDLYVCLRPVRWFRGVATPLLHPEKVHVTIFRENTEDIYAGIEWAAGTPEVRKVLAFLKEEMGVAKIRFPETTSIGVKPVSVEGTERLVRAAILYALEHKLPSVTLVHKGNIMKFTEGGFKKWGYALAEREFPDQTFTEHRFNSIKTEKGLDAAVAAYNQALSSGRVFIKDVIADAFLQNTLLKPEEYAVVATLNLNGDYISDQLAAMVGGIGIAPGANINYHTGHAIFEATHGTAPDIVGKEKANPCSLLLSGVMMLDYMGWHDAGKLITDSLEKLFEAGWATSDLARFMEQGKPLTTAQFSQKVIENL
ncbi:MAG: isocitrate dehydrogenase (NADP(+)) [Bacteroidetes bacterium GWD2_45_23]|nr:MAG: isocitrate dehydrogenase (NADP(+)) [Bacteroidetes bacterium GWC2_46_850]OFX73080.1 MAG: isocitrate dehydrogenase (NADP(+)) [Bacteroidetes bacterium GWC1_47_7]OFX86207.1 MAG: isocitrate dehydrogenase (NADP(+)) [Bacteroidetes bacterium GWD2_45_23]HAR37844.1 NADP-dependent isocitrate dehydrogenase [Porphyromonadaceae bacterium]HCC17341.1 NADP-dependent isocitrate dehydrogenase [Porphyromonadaceae bacterium]